MLTLNSFSEDTMTPLRERMIQDLQLRGYSDHTVEAYVRSVAQLARFYHASPDTLTEEPLRDYLVRLTTVQKGARGTHTIALCGLRLMEGVRLQVPDVDGDRKLVQIHGKRSPRIATSRSPTPRSSCSGRTGARTGTRSGSSPRSRARMPAS